MALSLQDTIIKNIILKDVNIEDKNSPLLPESIIVYIKEIREVINRMVLVYNEKYDNLHVFIEFLNIPNDIVAAGFIENINIFNLVEFYNDICKYYYQKEILYFINNSPIDQLAELILHTEFNINKLSESQIKEVSIRLFISSYLEFDLHKYIDYLPVNITNMYEFTPFMLACHYNDYESVKKQVDKGASINKINVLYGGTGICLTTDINIIKLLIENGADINMLDKSGQSPLYNACYNVNFELMEFLLEKRAEIQNNIIEYVCANGYTKILELLNKYNFKVTFEMVKIAYSNYYKDILESLLPRISLTIYNILECFNTHESVDSRAKEFRIILVKTQNPDSLQLIKEVYTENVAKIKVMLEAGVNPNVIDEDYDTPLLAAGYKKNVELLTLLFKYNADKEIFSDKLNQIIKKISRKIKLK